MEKLEGACSVTIKMLEQQLRLVATLGSEADAEPILFASPLPPRSNGLPALFASLSLQARALEEAAFAAAQHRQELCEFGVLGPDMERALHEMCVCLKEQLVACAGLLRATSLPELELVGSTGHLALRRAAKELQLAVVATLKRTSTKHALLGSRPIVRFVATAYALTEFAKKTEELFDALSDLAALLRNQQKKYLR